MCSEEPVLCHSVSYFIGRLYSICSMASLYECSEEPLNQMTLPSSQWTACLFSSTLLTPPSRTECGDSCYVISKLKKPRTLTPGFKISYLPSLWLSLLFTISLPTYGESVLKMITNADVMKTQTEVISPLRDHLSFFQIQEFNSQLSWHWNRSFTII